MKKHTPDFMHCPNCRSTRLCSFSEPERFRPYYEWECLDCGICFPDFEKFDIAASRLSTLCYVLFLFLLYFITSSIQIYILSLSDPEMLYALLVSIPAALLCLFLLVFCKVRIRKLVSRRNALIQNCYS